MLQTAPKPERHSLIRPVPVNSHLRLCKSYGQLSDAMAELECPSATPSRSLIILDLDGVLWQRNRKQVVLHEGVQEFLARCYAVADVGYFTSSTLANVEEPLNNLLTPQQRRDTVFIWDRSYCVPMKMPGRPYGTAKEIRKVLDAFPRYRGQKVVFVDDSPYKMILNPAQSIVIYDSSQSLLSLFDTIQQRLKIADAAELRSKQNYSPRFPATRSAPPSPLLSRYC